MIAVFAGAQCLPERQPQPLFVLFREGGHGVTGAVGTGLRHW
jgi:hypothetical protein